LSDAKDQINRTTHIGIVAAASGNSLENRRNIA
jgi:hypothetical protein